MSSRFRWTLVAILLPSCLILFYVLNPVASLPKNQPVLIIDQPRRDLGKVQAGHDLPVTFRLSNPGNSKVVIKSVVPSCGCAVAEVPDVIEADQSADLSMKIRTVGKSGPVSINVVVVAVRDGVEVRTTLTVAARIVDSTVITVNQTESDFGELRRSSAFERRIHVHLDDSAEPVALNSLSAPDWISIVSTPEIGVVAHEWVLTAAGTAPEQSGAFNEAVSLTFDSVDVRKTVFSIRGRVETDFYIVPASIVGFVETDEQYPREFEFQVLHRIENAPLSVASAVVNYEQGDADRCVEVAVSIQSNTMLKLTLSPGSGDRVARGSVEVTASMEAGNVTEKVQLPFVFLKRRT